MELEQAERFVAAAERDYEMAVGWYCVQVEGKAEGPEEIVAPRADVLAAQQVLRIARLELRACQEHQRAGDAYAGPCERCSRVGPRWVMGAAVLCADCAQRWEEEARP